VLQAVSPQSGSGTGHEKLLVRFSVRLDGSRGGDVLHELAAAFLAFVFNDANAAGRDVAGFETEDAAVAYLYVGAEPVGAEHSSGAIESHRSGDRTVEIFPSAGQDASAQCLRPGHAADQWIIEAAAFKGNGMREFAQLKQLQQDGTLRQVGDDDVASVAEMRSSLR